MQTSRRSFLWQTALLTTGLSFKPWSPFDLRAGDSDRKPLLVGRSDVPRMLEVVKLPRFAPYWKTLVDADLAADRKFLKDELRLNSHVADLLKARLILERTSFVYLLTGDVQQRDVATLAISRILDFPKWDYFLEGGTYTIGLQRAPETTLAMIFADEWLGDSLSASLREEIRKQVAEKGAPPCFRTLWGMRHPDRVRGWGFDPESDYKLRFDLSRWPIILNSTNLKVIPIAGLGVAGCWLYDSHPQAPEWVDMALQSARAYSTMFGADGCYEEGVSYWGYTALHLALFFDVLKRTRGIDASSLVNFEGTVRYALQLSMPTVGNPGDCVNFGDTSVLGNPSVADWVARNKRDELSQFVATEVGQVQSHHGIVWHDPAVQEKEPGPDLYDVRFSNDWVVSRTGWKTGDSVVALRSGLPANHEHADRNSVVFKAYGERLLHDPLHAAYSYTQPLWLLRKTEAHTAILIDGKGHQYHDGHEGTNSSWAEAHVVDYDANAKRMIVTSDATPAYNLVLPPVDLVQRTLIFVKPDILLFYDRVKLRSPLPVEARFQVYNQDGKGTREVKGTGFLIARPGVKLDGSCYGSGTINVRGGILPLKEEADQYPFVEVESSSNVDHELLTVCVAHPANEKIVMPVVTKAATGWNVAGRGFKITLTRGKTKPAVSFE